MQRPTGNQGRSLDLQTPVSVVQFKNVRFTRKNTYTCSARRLTMAEAWITNPCLSVPVVQFKDVRFTEANTDIHAVPDG